MTRACLVLLITAAQAAAQFSGAIQGTVTDATQAAIPDATLYVINTATGVAREAKTASEGFYRISNLGPGTYDIRAEKTGFTTSRLEGVVVGIGDIAKGDLTLAVGALAEQVKVEAQVSQLETEQGRVSGRIDRVQLKELPLNGRNIFNMISLQPGMLGRGTSTSAGSAGGGGDSFAGETSVQVYAGGQSNGANNFTVDDTSVNSSTIAGVTNTIPNAESVEEVRVVANNFSAVDGRNPGAQIQVSLKAGTNTVHGSASWYHQDNVLSSRNVFEAVVPVFRKNQFGYSVGGPIVKNRTFFFTTFEGLRQSGDRASTFTVETPEFRDFVVRTRPNSIAAKLLTGYQPGAYPTSSFRDLGSPSLGVNKIGPADGILDIGNVNYVPDSFRRAGQYTVRIDHELRPGKDRIYGSFIRTKNTTQAGGVRPSFDRALVEWANFGNLNETHIFSPNKINEFRAGVSTEAGNPWDVKTLAVPRITITNVSPYGLSSDTTITNVPGGWWQTSYDYKDIFSWVRSTHTLKMGGQLRRPKAASGFSTNYVPNYAFNDILDFADDEPLTTTRNVNPVTGLPQLNFSHREEKEWALFINDDWKVTRHFTLNLGLRYENFTKQFDTQGLRGFIFGDGGNFNQQLANGKLAYVDRLFPAQNLNFAPRMGFAWDPTGKGKMTVRGGFGVTYDRLAAGSNTYADRATAQLGLLLGTPNFTYSLGDPACKGDGRPNSTCKPYLGYPVEPGFQLGLDDKGGIKGTRISISSTDPNIQSPRVNNWFLGVQREVSRGTIVEVNYIGTQGHHLINSQNYNRFVGDLLINGKFTGFNQSFSSITIRQSTSNSIYHAATVQVKRAFTRGITMQAAYTVGKAIDDTGTWQNVLNRRAERAVSTFDAPQKLSLVGLWEMPFFKGKTWSYRILGGWQLSGFAILQAGNPLTVTRGGSYPTGDYNADGTAGDRPNAPLTSIQSSGWDRQAYLSGIFKVTDFPRPAPATDGNLGRNTYRGPGFAETELSLAKKFVITERLAARLRLDSFNAFNRVNLGNPSLDLNSPTTFGRSTSAQTPRSYQLGLKFEF